MRSTECHSSLGYIDKRLGEDITGTNSISQQTVATVTYNIQRQFRGVRTLKILQHKWPLPISSKRCMTVTVFLGAYIFIQSGVIDIFPTLKTVAAAILDLFG